MRGVVFTAFYAWYQKFNYKSDPLSIKPSSQIVSREKEKTILLGHLLSGNIVVLLGEAGLGKTSLLKAIEKELSNDQEFLVHYSSMLSGFAEIKRLCAKPSFFDKILFSVGLKKKKKKILLVDESHLLLLNQGEILKYLFDVDQIHSLVLASGEKDNLNLSVSFRKRIGEQVVLPKLSISDLKKLLFLRLNKTNPLSEETIDYLAKISDGNPRQFILNCKKVCIQVHEFFNGKDLIKVDNAKEIVVKKYSLGPEIKPVIEKKDAVQNLTPLQKSILDQLSQNSMNLKELSSATGSSIGTIGKQISVLSLKAKKDYMARKGITEPLINKDKDNGTTTYFLTENAKKVLMQAKA